MGNVKLVTAGATILLVACSSTANQGPSDSPFGNWLYTNEAGTAGEGITITQSDTYVVDNLALTSTTSADASEEIGTVVVTPTTITFTPQQSTCPGTHPSYTVDYTVTPGGGLTLFYSTGAIALHTNTGAASNNFVFTLGCFSTTGAFTAEALAPVMN